MVEDLRHEILASTDGSGGVHLAPREAAEHLRLAQVRAVHERHVQVRCQLVDLLPRPYNNHHNNVQVTWSPED